VIAPLRIARAICESGSNLFNRLRRHSRVAPIGTARPAKLRRRRAAPRFAAGGQADLRARSDMGIGLLFS
jgi:hypothetical protein